MHRLYFVLFTLIVLVSCDTSTPLPATLQVQIPTPLPSPTSVPTAILPTGVATSPPIDSAVETLLDGVQSDRLMITVGSLVDQKTRYVLSHAADTIGGIDGARDWLVNQFRAIRDGSPQQPISVWTQPVLFTWNGARIMSENVILVFQGTDVGAGVVIVGAHYDTMSSEPTIPLAAAPGANENGSGVAAMVEIARILAPLPHRATILFVALTAEETGRQGSQTFVKSYLQAQNPPIAVRCMINLDMIGSDIGQNGRVDHQTIRLFSAEPNDSPSRQLARQMVLIMKTYLEDEVNPVLQSAEERTGRWGDQQSFREAGYPSVRLIQGLEDPVREHNVRDTFDNVQPGYLMRVTRAALASIILLADGPQPPLDLALRTSADDPHVQRLVWTPIPGAARYLVALRQTSSLFYDQVLSVKASPSPELVWAGFGRYTTVAIATIDTFGRMGPMSAEVPLASLLRK